MIVPYTSEIRAATKLVNNDYRKFKKYTVKMSYERMYRDIILCDQYHLSLLAGLLILYSADH
jgi:hypothetical protein